MAWSRTAPWVVVLAVSACAAPASMSEAERARIEGDVRARVDAFQEAERRRDPDAILAFLAPDFYMYVDGARADYDTVAAQIRSTMPSLQRFETTWSDVEVRALGRDHALVSLVFRDEVTDETGLTTNLRGPTTFVWRLECGDWRILYADADHYPDER
jgi:ketosteroid isomerase-like protein